MKHIKLFEEINSIDYKKYVIYKPEFQQNSPINKYKYLYIFEIINIKNNQITVKKHYDYNSLENKFIPQNLVAITGSLDIFINHVIFTSDDLNECKDIIPSLNTANKFNL